jgi:phage FluMu protein Com
MKKLKLNQDDLKPVRCISCGRFLGMENIKVGIVRLKCKSCKQWTVLLGRDEDWSLTSENKAGKLK